MIKSTINTIDDNGEAAEIEAPFIVTTEGIAFYKEVNINGTALNGFKNVEGGLEYPEINNSSIILKAIVPPINQQFVNNLWATSFSNLGEFGQYYWAYMRDNVMPTINQYYAGTVTYYYFGKYSSYFGSVYSLVGYMGVNSFDYELIDEDMISLTYNSTGGTANGRTFAGSGFLYAASFLNCPFGATYQGVPVTRTFKVTTDNIKNPTEIILTDVNQPANTIRLTSNDISNPLIN